MTGRTLKEEDKIKESERSTHTSDQINNPHWCVLLLEANFHSEASAAKVHYIRQHWCQKINYGKKNIM